MSSNKGITGVPGLMGFAIVVIIVLTVVYVLTSIPGIEKIIAIHGEARFALQQDDRGTGLAAFLASDMGGGSYAEILGGQAAANADKDLDAQLRQTLEKMKPAGRVAVYDSGGREAKKYGDVAENYFSADIALPGVRKGEARVE